MNIVFPYLAAESLGIEILSSVLKKHGHQTSLAFDPGLFDDKQYLDVPVLKKVFSFRSQLLENMVASKPDLAAFSVGTDNYLWACEVAGELKKRLSVPVIFGGLHPTAVPDRVISNDFVDMVCVGEGEGALLDLVESMEGKRLNCHIPNIWFKKNGQIIKNPVRPLIQDLDSLPLPDKTLFENDILIRRGKYMVMTSRGCPFNCTYCYNNVLKRLYSHQGRYVRQRSVDNVIEELRHMKDKYNFSSVAFMDDLFAANPGWFKDFVAKYERYIAVPYSFMTDTTRIDHEMASLLKRSGCVRIQFGIQTMNEKIRREILNRPFETNEDISKALDICEQMKISYSLDHIFGIPYEGEADYKATAMFYSQTAADRICCYALSYYPKTGIIGHAKRTGLLDDENLREIEEGKGRLYVYGSCLKDKDLKLFKCFRMFYALAPIVPVCALRILLTTDLHKYLRFIPRFIALFFEMIAALKTMHPRGIDYVKYYLFHIGRRLGFL